MLQVNRALWCMISVEKSANFWIKFSLSKWRGVVISSCCVRNDGPGVTNAAESFHKGKRLTAL
jgi:hypothetical protein